jgi:hypothetical protein
MLVRTKEKIVNLDRIREITIDEVYLQDIYESDITDVVRAIFAISISIATDEAVKRYTLSYLGNQEESNLKDMEATKEKVKDYALDKLSEIFGAKCLEYI